MTNWSAKSSRKSRSSGKRRLIQAGVALAVFVAGAGALDAYLRITINGVTLSWPSSTVSWQLNTAGSEDIPDGSHEAAIAAAFESWERLPGSNVNLVRGADTGSTAVGDSGSHIVVFDETNFSGYFPGSSGIVAITPISYLPGSGQILDADIIFNGKNYAFATDGSPGSFDVQAVLTHEIGHFIGLDHSPVVGGTMWPYVSTGNHWSSSLSHDDEAGAAELAGSGADGALAGALRKEDGSILPGGIVGAVDTATGRLMGTTLSNPVGDWRIQGLPAGSYYVHVSPLEGGMTAGNVTGNGTVHTDFGAEFYGTILTPTPFGVSSGGQTNCGLFMAEPDHGVMDATGTAVRFTPGQTRQVMMWGSGFPLGLSVLSLSPHLTVNSINNGSTWAQVSVTVAAGAPLGSYDLYLRTPNGRLAAALGVVDVVAPPPVVDSLDVTSGAAAGGTLVTLEGSGFQGDCFVLFDGMEAAAVTFVNGSTLEVVTPNFGPGVAELSVHNPDGQQERLPAAFTFLSTPAVSDLFPQAGQSAGGTTVLVSGNNFDAAAAVRFDGDPAAVEYLSSTLLRVATPAHAVGGADVTVENPGGGSATVSGAFSFESTPDPSLSSFTPTTDEEMGGAVVTLTGSNLTGVTSVRFGANPVTGTGGKEATGVTVVSDSELTAVAPSYPPGAYGIVVANAAGQGAVAPAVFTFQPSASSAGGGCGGVSRAGSRRGGVGDLPAWALLFASFHLLRRRGRRMA